MNNIIKIILLTLSFSSLAAIGHAAAQVPDSAGYKKIKQLTEQAKAQFAPDGRTAILTLDRPKDLISGTYRITTTAAEAKAYLKKKLAENPTLRTKVMINLLPDSTVIGYRTGIVNLSVANLRVTPSNQAELASQVLLGTPLDLLQKRDGYFRARTPEGYIAWVKTSAVVPKTAAELAAWKATRKIIVTADFGHSYTEPEIAAERVSDLAMGGILEVTGNNDGFVKVNYPDGRVAYIGEPLTAPFDEWLGTRNPTPERVLAVAKSMMGLPYVWGGTSVKGVDCSGFTKTAFYMNGVVIPRDASQQVLAGKPVDILTADTLDIRKAMENLQPADLLFFASGSHRRPDARITHVALYLGDGEFIHSAGTVRINSIRSEAANYDDFQTRTLVAARRYIGETDADLQPLAKHRTYVDVTDPKQ